MSNLITLYDIPSTVPGKAWAPNPWKTRYCLNYKGLAHKTEWVEYPDIKAVSIDIGASPTGIEAGIPAYTVPAIYDPSTQAVIAESAAIAQYLDDTYPDTPKLFPPGTRPLQIAFANALMPRIIDPIWQFTHPVVHALLNPESQPYFRRTREATVGMKLEVLTPTGTAGEAEWAKVKAGFEDVDRWLQKGKADGPYFLGKEPTFVDFVVASYVIWPRSLWGVESSQWKEFMSWSDGRWAAYIKLLEKYETVVQ